MSASDSSLRTTLRIPGNWLHPGELIDRLEDGYRLTQEALFLPDGRQLEFVPMPPDGEFPEIFRSSCRRPATRDEQAVVRHYTVNIGLHGPCGSLAAARTMLEAGAAIVKAGGAGVFNDNSGLAHGGANWLELAEDSGPEAISFAFVSLIRDRTRLTTMGMHVMGLPDLILPVSGDDRDAELLIDTVCYLCRGEKPVGDGHLLADESGPRFQTRAAEGDGLPESSPMHNPFGRLRLVPIRDAAAEN